jgi:hypothetical protein
MFAEHMGNLIVATLHNLFGYRNVWIHLTDTTNKEKWEKYTADGVLKMWEL